MGVRIVQDVSVRNALRSKVRWHSRSVGLACCLGALAAAADAEVVEIVWDSTGAFAHVRSVAPGKFAEVCGRLGKGQLVDWSFESAAPLDFNVHYHQGRKVVFPERRSGIGKLGGRLRVPAEQDYCWMWANKSAAEISLTLSLRKK